MSNPKTKPTIGTPAWWQIRNDSYACTVTQVTPSGKTVWVRRTNDEKTEDFDFYANQQYIYRVNPEGASRKLSLRKDGRFRGVGKNESCYILCLGRWVTHIDPSF